MMKLCHDLKDTEPAAAAVTAALPGTSGHELLRTTGLHLCS